MAFGKDETISLPILWGLYSQNRFVQRAHDIGN